ncbi:MAG: hypothetical protein HY335_05000 [Deinococcus sp.]|nr:hypothetical protein [Deinococcus sp.]
MEKARVRKVHLLFPETLIQELNRTVRPRTKSQFVVEAVQEKLDRLRLEKGLRAGFGAWRDKNHPDLRTHQDMERYLRALRHSTQERLRRLARLRNEPLPPR